MLRRVEAVGWGFFLTVAAVLVGPLIYFFFQIVEVEENPMAPFGLSVLSAMLAAGLLAWLTNTVLQWFHSRRQPKGKQGGNVQRVGQDKPSKPSKTERRTKRGKRRKQKAK